MTDTLTTVLGQIAHLYDDYNREALSEVFYDLFTIHCEWDWPKCDAFEAEIFRTGIVPMNTGEFVLEFWVEPTPIGVLFLMQGAMQWN